ncbi:MAG: flagellar basal body-associated FliL family protein [Lachnospiraceae bacterium]|nr:flagellar basal body-associated FliL family protein [Lachnospiraceae bacterium]
MKKNLISIVILALLIVNIALTAIMMFSMTSASKKTAALVDDISTALNLELEASKNGGGSYEAAIPMSDIATYDISEKMTIPLKMEQDAEGNDGDPHFFIAVVTLSMNTKDKDYKTYGSEEEMQSRESLIKSEINDIVSQYTVNEARNNQDQIRTEILDRVQTMFDSEFIFNVAFSDIMIQ